MDNILLCTNHIPLTTSIHNTFIEEYMLDANGSYVKVYLYLAKCLQHGEQGFSISSLANRMENTENDILHALQYWEKKELLYINRNSENGEIVGIEMLIPQTKEQVHDSASIAATSETATPDIRVVSQDTTKKQTSQSDLTSEEKIQSPTTIDTKSLQDLSTDETFSWLCNVVEIYLDHPMLPKDLNLLAYLYGTLHFSSDLILHLYDYCINMGKKNSNYIQTVALNWHDAGISTPEEAEAASIAYSGVYNAVSKAFALGRALGSVEKNLVDKWQREYEMDLSVILEACNRTLLALHKPNFKYTDKILSEWNSSGIRTLQGVEQADAAYNATKKETQKTPKNLFTGSPKSKNQFQSFQQREVSVSELNELERKLLMHS